MFRGSAPLILRHDLKKSVVKMKHIMKNKQVSDILLILWAGGAALLSYSLVYALRKPYTAAAFEGLLPEVMARLSLFERFYVFVNGVFDWTAVVYYASVIGFFLFLTVQSLEKRRYN